MKEYEPVWGSCEVCGVGIVRGYIVWHELGTIGSFACGKHLGAMKLRVRWNYIEEI
jgi:hypothetical protein